MSERLVLMGAILGAHGIKGEVKVKSFTARPSAIADYGPLLDPKRKRSFDLAVTGQGDAAKGIVIARIAGIADRNAAETLKGIELFVDREKLPAPTEPDEFYLADLIGLAALDKAGAKYEFVSYSGAVHSFSVPGADAHNVPGLKYNKPADEASWSKMKALFASTLGK